MKIRLISRTNGCFVVSNNSKRGIIVVIMSLFLMFFVEWTSAILDELRRPKNSEMFDVQSGKGHGLDSSLTSLFRVKIRR